MLEIKGVKKVYDTNGIKRTALNKVSLNFRKSEFAAILGPSGSGKTTLLNIIGGLDQYTKGDLIVNGRSTKMFKDKDWDAYRNHRIGFVFQSYNLIPHQTVLQNVRLALTLSGISKKESIRRAKRALREVGLADEIYKRPAQLSGGQMQRVAIARALVNNPEIVLADEPTGALDSETSLQIMDILKKVAKDRLVIMVTHNPDLADEYATRIIRLKDGEITSDSNPCDDKEEEEEDKSERRRHTKMTYWTALSLSLRNLLTKKARTILIAVAGSIGIIGIALISAVSNGFQKYIDTIEEDTLTSYPLTLMEESADLTGMILSVTGQSGIESGNGKVQENQVMTGVLGSVSHNDLASFMNYMDIHKSDIDKDVRLIEKQYNVDPLIYTVDATGQLAKLNPSNLFSTLIGDTSLLTTYSSLTSVFQQKELENMQQESELLAGRWPENYNEMVLSLRDPGVIPDLITYSLGFHDTSELSTILAKIMNGEPVEPSSAPLELTYDQLMSVDLRLIPETSTYKFNEKYDVYENMSDNEEYMMNLFENGSERLKIVGIVTPTSDMSTTANGVLYLPSLVTHIIDEAAKTEIVKRQLANPTIDIFSNKPFGEENNSFDFEFSDLVSVDNAALEKAFGVTIDQGAIEAKTREYMGGISDDIGIGTGEVPTVREALVSKFEELANGLNQKFQEKYDEKGLDLAGVVGTPPSLMTFDGDKFQSFLEGYFALMGEFADSEVDAYVATQDFSGLASVYGLPVEAYQKFYGGMLKIYAASYSSWYLNEILSPVMELLKAGGGGLPGDFGGASGGLAQGDFGIADSLAIGKLPAGASFPMLEFLNGTYNPKETLKTLFENLPMSDAEEILKQMPDVDYSIIPTSFDTLSVQTAQMYLNLTILTKVGGLTQYLSSQFADAFHIDQNALINSFHLNFTEDELTRVISAMFNKKEVSLSSNLSDLGYQNLDEPTRIAFYFTSFEGKTAFMSFLDDYNEQMESAGEEEKAIDYTDTTGMLMSSVEVIVDAVSYVLIAFVSISLVVSSIMIGVITYISVYERKKEIGILRAMGASKHNISSIFNAETMIIGFLAGIFGVGISYLLIPPINMVLHHFTGDIPLSAALNPVTAVLLVILSVVLTLIGGLIPAHSASKKDPVEALRSGD